MSNKAPSPKEFLLEEQAITQATSSHMTEETLAAKCRALQVANTNLKRDKAQSALNLP